ncbi:MAG: Hpt domain-containing protein [Alphaproteobacteria bacterium]|nr:Hpt domain-containing protein [Alphaproteobacteria bacterium]
MLDLQMFRDNIGTDPDTEAMLLRLYIESSDEMMMAIAAQLKSNDVTAKEWDEQLHFLKGAALNIGAMPFVRLLTKGQLIAEQSSQEKNEFFAELSQEYNQLRIHISSFIAM